MLAAERESIDSDGCGTIIKMDDYGKADVFTGALTWARRGHGDHPNRG